MLVDARLQPGSCLTTRDTGQCKWFDGKKGYGFITVDPASVERVRSGEQPHTPRCTDSALCVPATARTPAALRVARAGAKPNRR